MGPWAVTPLARFHIHLPPIPPSAGDWRGPAFPWQARQILQARLFRPRNNPIECGINDTLWSAICSRSASSAPALVPHWPQEPQTADRLAAMAWPLIWSAVPSRPGRGGQVRPVRECITLIHTVIMNKLKDIACYGNNSIHLKGLQFCSSVTPLRHCKLQFHIKFPDVKFNKHLYLRFNLGWDELRISNILFHFKKVMGYFQSSVGSEMEWLKLTQKVFMFDPTMC